MTMRKGSVAAFVIRGKISVRLASVALFVGSSALTLSNTGCTANRLQYDYSQLQGALQELNRDQLMEAMMDTYDAAGPILLRYETTAGESTTKIFTELSYGDDDSDAKVGETTQLVELDNDGFNTKAAAEITGKLNLTANPVHAAYAYKAIQTFVLGEHFKSALTYPDTGDTTKLLMLQQRDQPDGSTRYYWIEDTEPAKKAFRALHLNVLAGKDTSPEPSSTKVTVISIDDVTDPPSAAYRVYEVVVSPAYVPEFTHGSVTITLCNTDLKFDLMWPGPPPAGATVVQSPAGQQKLLFGIPAKKLREACSSDVTNEQLELAAEKQVDGDDVGLITLKYHKKSKDESLKLVELKLEKSN